MAADIVGLHNLAIAWQKFNSVVSSEDLERLELLPYSEEELVEELLNILTDPNKANMTHSGAIDLLITLAILND